MRDTSVNMILDHLLPDASSSVRSAVQKVLLLVSVRSLVIAALAGACIGFTVALIGRPETPEQLAADHAAEVASQQEQAARDAYLKEKCDPLYAQWDRVYNLHRDYGDHVATAADADLAHGLWSACIKNEP